MRGKLHRLPPSYLPPGITPAYAGKTWRAFEHGELNEDHPRVCGENSLGLSNNFPQYGSPPRMRGKRTAYEKEGSSQRITPAYAGKTERQSKRPRPPEDHPRVCGENCASFSFNSLNSGSPPRMRGKPSASASKISRSRITPAYAGKTP